MLTIRFFASLREQLGADEVTLDIDTATVAEIRHTLVRDYPEWADSLDNPHLLAAVNHAMARDETEARDGDEVAFFPPVTGG